MSSRTHSAQIAQPELTTYTIPSSRPFAIQAKMTIGQPNDKYEQEADQVADQVVNKLQRMETSEDEMQMQTTDKGIQRESEMPEMEEEELQMKPDIQREMAEEEELQMKSEKNQTPEASPEIENTINQRKGSGSPLPDLLRSKLEQAIGADFTGVKVHTDNTADTLNRSLSAKAFTTGQDIFFKSGEYNPNSTSGQKLLTHELTHTVQQNPQISRKSR
jgi:hypothetical protein